jgi:hypothetical protein
MAKTQGEGWILVSNNFDNSLRLTGVVHHVDGCNLSNGRNQLIRIANAEAATMQHCMRCEAALGHRDPVSRPPEGTKVEVRLPADVLAEVDQRAAASGRTRAATLRALIETGLQR